jgi:hypothetical protein
MTSMTTMTAGTTSTTPGTDTAADTTGTTGDTADETTGDATQGEDETEGTTGTEVCTIELPPPGTCDSNVVVPWMPSIVAGGPQALSDADLVSPVEVEQDTHDDGGGFIDPGDPPEACDIWEQDCEAGEKCMPWDSSGQGSWNATRCTPLDPNPAGVGDPCTVEGSGTSGVDNCELGAMCWGVDAQTNMGHCIELCSCAPDNPICETPNTFCSITNMGVLPLCLSVCNPLDADACGAGEGCYPSSGYFICAPNASGDDHGNVGDPCQFINVCNHGLMCVDASGVPGCGASGCCSSFCTIGNDAACLPGQSCVPFYDQGTAPDDCLAEIGVCIVP